MLATTQTLTTLLVFAVLIQFCVDRVKEIFGDKLLTVVKAPVWALAFGILFAVLFQLDLFSMLGLPATVPIIAYLVTGLILSASSASIHELIEKLRQSRISDQRFLFLGKAATEALPGPKGELQNDENMD